MPSQRKRIGFLPRPEVQDIIDQICKHNKLSQSKVTGILVDEALSSRGVLNSSVNNKSYKFDSVDNDSLLINIDSFHNKTKKINTDILNFDEGYIKDEIQMINDFIEFKFFRNIMNKNNNKK